MKDFLKVDILRPIIDDSLCTNCGVCAELCEFNALAALPKTVMVFNELCHGCGLCTLACPANAITEKPHNLGLIRKAELDTGNNGNLIFYEGILNIGEALATPIIKKLKKLAFNEDSHFVILDLPPGAACPVVEGLSDIDFAVLVTEPTRAGEHDLKIVIDLVSQLNVPFGIVNNRSNVGDDRIAKLAEINNYPLLLEIPHDQKILQLYSRGIPLIGSTGEFDSKFNTLRNRILAEAS